MTTSPEVSGMLLTGGASRRMGRPKALLRWAGSDLAHRTADLLSQVASVAIEVGPGWSGLPAVKEDPPGQGPLMAVVAGWRALRQMGRTSPVLVVACDLPGLDQALLETLAHWPGAGTVIPRLEGRDQPLCARWDAATLRRAEEVAAVGERSLRWLSELDLIRLEERDWVGAAGPDVLRDVDTPADLARWVATAQGRTRSDPE